MVGITDKQWERLNMILENPHREAVNVIELRLAEHPITEIWYWQIVAKHDDKPNSINQLLTEDGDVELF